jgi:dihydrofolate reductase
MLIYSMSVSVDGFICDRSGDFDWSVPGEEQFRFHVEETRRIGAFLCGRRLYEIMRPWETDPALSADEDGAAFADAWSSIPKIVFSRTRDRVEGNARLAEGSLVEEIGAALAETDKHVGIGGAGLASQAIELGFVDEFFIFRNPIIVGGGTPLLPPITQNITLELLETRTFADRVVFEHYRRVAGASS